LVVWPLPLASIWATILAVGKTFKMLLATLAVGGSVLAPVAVGAADDKTVLLIYAEARLIPAIITADQTIRSTIQSRSPSPVRFYTEYLDLSWFPSERQERQLTRLMKHKYAGLKVDLIMACGDAALRFALRERAVLFPNVPIVFCGAEHGSIREVRLPPDVTGVTMLVDWAAGVEVALRLEPRTQRIVFVGGTGPIERVWEGLARQAFSKYESRVTRPASHPAASRLLQTGEVFGLLVAGAGYAECYTAPETYWIDLR